MIIPVNFIVGAVVGAVSTYLYKDEASKKWFRKTGSKVKNSVCSVVSSATSKNGEKVTESSEQAEEEVVANKSTENTGSAKPKQRPETT